MKTLRVFLASSDSLRKERDEIELFFRRENDKADSSGVIFEVIRWELMSSSFHQGRKQDEFNAEVLGCDIFICLIHDRVGEFTKEEFETAYKGFTNEGRPAKIYVYFVDYSIRPSKLDTDFQTVIALKDEIRTYQQIYGQFENLPELIIQIDRNLRLDLGTLVQPIMVSASKIPLSESEEDDEGYLDLQESCMAEIGKVHQSMTRIIATNVEFCSKIMEHIARLQEINARGNSSKKMAVNRFAADLESFALSLETETLVISESMTKAMNAYRNSVRILPDFQLNNSDYSRLERELVSLEVLQDTIKKEVDANSRLRQTIATIGRITTQFNHSRRHALIVLDSFGEAIERTVIQIAEVYESIQGILKLGN